MKIFVFVSTPETTCFAQASSLAAMTGILAQQSTLLVDLSDQPAQAREVLTITNHQSVEHLVDQFIRSHTIDANALRQQLVQCYPPTDWGTGWNQRSFDFLAGPKELTPNYLDRLVDHRGVAFARKLVEASQAAGYQTFVVYFGQNRNMLLSDFLGEISDVRVLCSTQENPKLEIDRVREYPRVQQNRYFFAPVIETPYPHPDFVSSLKSQHTAWRNTAAKQALEWAQAVYPEIADQLLDGENNRIRVNKRFIERLRSFLEAS